MLLRVINDTTPFVSNHLPARKNQDCDKEVKVDTSAATEATAPVDDTQMEGDIKEVPYVESVADPNLSGIPNVKAGKIMNGEDTGGSEQQLNGTGGIGGQLGGIFIYLPLDSC